MPAAHVIVHAAFKAKNVLPPVVEKFTITVDPNGGNWAGDTAKKTYEIANGGSFMLPEAPVKQGYTFLFWKGSAYRPGDHYLVKEDHTFTAEWKKNEAQIESKISSMTTEGKAPKTGDSGMLSIYASAVLVAAGGMLILARKKKMEG